MSTCGQRDTAFGYMSGSQTRQPAAAFVDDGKKWLTQVFFPLLTQLSAMMKRRFLDNELMKVAKAADAVMPSLMISFRDSDRSM
jgi:hypothetical protein